MKNILLVSILISLLGCNQQEDKTTKQNKIPESIEAAFKNIHPTATVLKWNDESPIWEVKYEEGSEKGAVSFNSKGEVIETELVISESELQNLPSIPEYIKTTYPTETIKGCEKIEKKDGTVVYEIQITGKELVFDNKGNFLNEELD